MDIHLAGCIILDKHHHIYLLHRNKKDLTQWELPGGKVELNENVEMTARREIKEELGITVSLMRQLGIAHFEENNIKHIYTWFLAIIEEGKPSIQEPETFDNLRSFSFDELSNIKLSSNMRILHEAIRVKKVVLAEFL